MKSVLINNLLVIATFFISICVLGQNFQQLDIEERPSAITYDSGVQKNQPDVEYQVLIHKAKELGDPSKSHSTIFDLCSEGDIIGVSHYLASGGNPNLSMQHTKHHYSLLDSAIISAQADIVELLLQHGADVNAVIGGVAPPLSLSLELLQLAKNKRDTERIERFSRIVNLLQAYGAMETEPVP